MMLLNVRRVTRAIEGQADDVTEAGEVREN